MNKLVMADAILFLMGTLFGLGLGYILSITAKHIRMDKKEEFRVLKGGKDDQ